MRILQKRLENGMTYFGVETPHSPNSVISITVKRGSLEDTKPGTSHFLEHMLFEPNPESKQMYARELDGLGIESDAFTDWHITSFTMEHAPQHTEVSLLGALHLATNQDFGQNRFEIERNVIRMEILKYADDLQDKLWTGITDCLYESKSSNILGTLKDLKQITVEDLKDAYKNYIAQNMIVGYIGPRNPAEFIKFISDVPLQTKGRIQTLPPLKKKQNHIALEDNVGVSHVQVGFHTPPGYTKEAFALNIAKTHLSQGEFSELYQFIRTQNGWSYTVSEKSEMGCGYSFSAFQTEIDGRRRVKKTIEFVKNAITRTATISKTDFERAREKLAGATEARDWTKYDMLAAITNIITMGKSPHMYFNQAEAIRSVSYDTFKKTMAQIAQNPISSYVINPK